MFPSKITDKQYIISLDSLDLSCLSKFAQNITEQKQLLWSKQFLDGDSAYYEVEIVCEELQSTDYCLELDETYLCNLCNTAVPQSCYTQHIQSKMHQCYKVLAEKVLENVAKQIKNDNDYDKNYDKKDLYYCEICSKLVYVKYQQKHSLSSYHLKSIEKEKLANDFLDMYTQTQDTGTDNIICSMKDINQNLSEYNSVSHISCPRDDENSLQDNNSEAPFISIVDKSTDTLFSYESEDEEFVLALSSPNESLQVRNMNGTNLESYFKKMIAKYKMNFSAPIIDNNNIVIVTPKGYTEHISIDTFHGYKKLNTFVHCQLCDMWVEQNIDQHSVTEQHVRNIMQPINDDFLRTVINTNIFIPNNSLSHCLLCNQIISTGSNHALVNPNHKKYNHRNVAKNTDINMEPKTFCDVCSRNMRTADFPAHIKGNGHKTNLKKQIHTTSVLNAQPNGATSSNSILSQESLLDALSKKGVETQSNGIGVKINKKTFCDVCHKYIDTHNFASHCKGKIHKTMSNVNVNITPAAQLHKNLGSESVNVNKTFCNTCQVHVPNGGMAIHIKGKPHRRNEEKNHKIEDSQILSTKIVLPIPSTQHKLIKKKPRKKKKQTVESA